MEKLTLSVGAYGEDVNSLKHILKALDYRVSEHTSDFDIKTRSAVEAFQNDSGLRIDGIVNAATWTALEKSYSKTNVMAEADSVITEAEELEEEEQSAEILAEIPVETLTEALTETAEPTATAVTTRPTLRQGDRGAYVVELQDSLKALGYLTGQSDGIFGPATANAVRVFQDSNGLTADGVVGVHTWNAIDNAFSAPPDIPPVVQKPTLRMGDAGEHVTRLQADLKQLGFYHGTVDGKFGSGTNTAVRNFQESAGLRVDGIVGNATWSAIDNAINVPPTECPALKEGPTGSYVTILQGKLKCLGFFAGSVTGSFGPETTKAVKAFQRANGLMADGVVGYATWKLLCEQTANPQTPETLPEGPRPTLRYGDSGAFVTVLQKDLADLLYYSGAITSKFDWETQVAVRAFQDANRLTPDGIVGRATWHALYSLYPPPIEW